ncbi:MarR family transcriptional regulator [Aurantivibrio plasticivorans]
MRKSIANPSASDLLKLDNQICHSVYSAANALVRAYRPLLEPLDLTYPQYLVMLSLWESDGVNIKRISEHTRLDSGTLTPILKRLEQKALLERLASPNDERQKVIVLTSAGKKLRKKAEAIPHQIYCLGISDLKKIVQLKSLCEEMYQELTRDDG